MAPEHAFKHTQMMTLLNSHAHLVMKLAQQGLRATRLCAQDEHVQAVAIVSETAEEEAHSNDL